MNSYNYILSFDEYDLLDPDLFRLNNELQINIDKNIPNEILYSYLCIANYFQNKNKFYLAYNNFVKCLEIIKKNKLYRHYYLVVSISLPVFEFVNKKEELLPHIKESINYHLNRIDEFKETIYFLILLGNILINNKLNVGIEYLELGYKLASENNQIDNILQTIFQISDYYEKNNNLEMVIEYFLILLNNNKKFKQNNCYNLDKNSLEFILLKISKILKKINIKINDNKLKVYHEFLELYKNNKYLHQEIII